MNPYKREKILKLLGFKSCTDKIYYYLTLAFVGTLWGIINGIQ
jgi:hypothetical protein